LQQPQQTLPGVFAQSAHARRIHPAADPLAQCRAQLSAYKVPARVQVTEEIPRTGSGKIMRFKLQALLP
jgi:acyl-coenzyme A synthetase/AMP-(fatty) acid ligase